MGSGKKPRASIGDCTHVTTDPAIKLAPLVAPFRSTGAEQKSFIAAGDQFTALARFGRESAHAVLVANEPYRQSGFENAFIKDGVIAIDAHGNLKSYLEYVRAVEAIQAKAVVLGYGAQAQAVPIDSVPGGYVGRFGGHDIYAPAQ
jgi:hypothetical protein